MYTPPVPPVTMFSVRPVKSGVAEAAAVPGTVAVGAACRGAAQAAATISSAASGAKGRTGNLISQPPGGRSLLSMKASYLSLDTLQRTGTGEQQTTPET